MRIQYKICIVYAGRVERCIYAYANDYKHALNIGRLNIKRMYGNKQTRHYVTAEKIKRYDRK